MFAGTMRDSDARGREPRRGLDLRGPDRVARSEAGARADAEDELRSPCVAGKRIQPSSASEAGGRAPGEAKAGCRRPITATNDS